MLQSIWCLPQKPYLSRLFSTISWQKEREIITIINTLNEQLIVARHIAVQKLYLPPHSLCSLKHFKRWTWVFMIEILILKTIGMKRDMKSGANRSVC